MESKSDRFFGKKTTNTMKYNANTLMLRLMQPQSKQEEQKLIQGLIESQSYDLLVDTAQLFEKLIIDRITSKDIIINEISDLLLISVAEVEEKINDYDSNIMADSSYTPTPEEYGVSEQNWSDFCVLANKAQEIYKEYLIYFHALQILFYGRQMIEINNPECRCTLL